MEFTEVLESTFLVLKQWQFAQDRSFDNFLGFMAQADGMEQWERPNADIIKVNTDVALFENSNSYSYSMLVRDSHGELVEAVTSSKHGSITLELAEAIGKHSVGLNEKHGQLWW